MKSPRSLAFWLLLAITTTCSIAQEPPKAATGATAAALAPSLRALGVPQPGPTNDAPYAPQPILQGGVVVPLYPPGSPLLKSDRLREAEQYNLSKAVPGRISSIVNIHNPSMLQAGIPNVELHIYGNGRHPGDTLSDGSRMSAGLADRNGIPFGKWQDRFIDWFRDLGFLQKPGVETKAARDITTFLSQPARGADRRAPGGPGTR